MAKYLANELSEEERINFEGQLVDDETLQVELEQYLNVWAESSPDTAMSFDQAKAWKAVAKETKSPARIVPLERKPRYTLLKIAATLLIVLTAGYFLSETARDSVNGLVGVSSLTEVATGAEMRDVSLPDGTIVKLNANSQLAYEKGFGEAHRDIILTGGANFDVARNESLPFIIEASNGKVEVLGTSFDVKAYPGKNVELNVAEGTVKFSSAEEEIEPEVLNAGEKAKLSTDGKSIEKDLVVNENYSAWWTRKLKFDETPIEEVVQTLEETYWVDIELSGESLKGCKLTSTYDNYSLDQVLKYIVDTYVGNQLKAVRTKENKIKLEGKPCAN